MEIGVDPFLSDGVSTQLLAYQKIQCFTFLPPPMSRTIDEQGVFKRGGCAAVGSKCGGKGGRPGLAPPGIDINEYKTWSFPGVPYRKGGIPGGRIRSRGMPIIGNLFPSLTTIDSSDSLLPILEKAVLELCGEGLFSMFFPLLRNGGLSSDQESGNASVLRERTSPVTFP
jgi:hypothetical protein